MSDLKHKPSRTSPIPNMTADVSDKTAPEDSPGVPSEIAPGALIGDENADGLQRRLSQRPIQLISIGGSIGTALFVTIGEALTKAGPAGLLLAYGIYNIMLGLVNNSMAEMATYMPVSGGFIRLASKWVDDSVGFMVGWNFFIYEALLIPFEITAVTLVLSFWRDDIPPEAVCVACIVLYA